VQGKSSEALRGAPYLLPLAEISRRAAEAWDRGATEVCLQGWVCCAYISARQQRRKQGWNKRPRLAQREVYLACACKGGLAIEGAEQHCDSTSRTVCRQWAVGLSSPVWAPSPHHQGSGDGAHAVQWAL